MNFCANFLLKIGIFNFFWERVFFTGEVIDFNIHNLNETNVNAYHSVKTIKWSSIRWSIFNPIFFLDRIRSICNTYCLFIIRLLSSHLNNSNSKLWWLHNEYTKWIAKKKQINKLKHFSFKLSTQKIAFFLSIKINSLLPKRENLVYSLVCYYLLFLLLLHFLGHNYLHSFMNFSSTLKICWSSIVSFLSDRNIILYNRMTEKKRSKQTKKSFNHFFRSCLSQCSTDNHKRGNVKPKSQNLDRKKLEIINYSTKIFFLEQKPKK